MSKNISAPKSFRFLYKSINSLHLRAYSEEEIASSGSRKTGSGEAFAMGGIDVVLDDFWLWVAPLVKALRFLRLNILLRPMMKGSYGERNMKGKMVSYT